MRFCVALTVLVALLALTTTVNAQSSVKDRGGRAKAASWLDPLCRSIGAAYVSPPAAPLPTCRLSLKHQGRTRFADVYFPKGYSASSQVPLWLHLHGLYKPNWQSTSQPRNGGLNHMKRAAEHVASTWGAVNGWLANKAILVYPDSTGTPPGPQLWNSGFWQCPYKSDPTTCVDGDVDDVGFLELVTQTLLDKLPSAPTHQVFALGFSNGGMILTTMLCKSDFFRSTLSGAALVNTVLARDYLFDECQLAEPGVGPQVPLVFIHGLQDPLFSFTAGNLSATGNELLSTLGMVDDWATKYGCPSSTSRQAGGSWPPVVYTAGEGVVCRDYCYTGGSTAAAATADGSHGSSSSSSSNAGQRPVLWLCGIDQGKHDWDKYKADLAWTFFTQHKQLTTAEPLAEPNVTAWQPLQQPPAPAVSPAAAVKLPGAKAEAATKPTPPDQQQQQVTVAAPQPAAPAATEPAELPEQPAAASSTLHDGPPPAAETSVLVAEPAAAAAVAVATATKPVRQQQRPRRGPRPVRVNPAVTWDTAPDCPHAVTSGNSQPDKSGRLWGYDAVVGRSCVFKTRTGAAVMLAAVSGPAAAMATTHASSSSSSAAAAAAAAVTSGTAADPAPAVVPPAALAAAVLAVPAAVTAAAAMPAPGASQPTTQGLASAAAAALALSWEAAPPCNHQATATNVQPDKAGRLWGYDAAAGRSCAFKQQVAAVAAPSTPSATAATVAAPGPTPAVVSPTTLPPAAAASITAPAVAAAAAAAAALTNPQLPTAAPGAQAAAAAPAP